MEQFSHPDVILAWTSTHNGDGPGHCGGIARVAGTIGAGEFRHSP